MLILLFYTLFSKVMQQTNKVSSYIESLPTVESDIADILRHLILTAVPLVEEKLSFKIPFYHYFGMFCYINHLKKTGGIELAFCRGKDLIMAFPELQLQNRTMVAGLAFYKEEDCNLPFLLNVIETAADWQKQAWAEKRPFVKAGKTRKK
jgi:uncharacterized protein